MSNPIEALTKGYINALEGAQAHGVAVIVICPSGVTLKAVNVRDETAARWMADQLQRAADDLRAKIAEQDEKPRLILTDAANG